MKKYYQLILKDSQSEIYYLSNGNDADCTVLYLNTLNKICKIENDQYLPVGVKEINSSQFLQQLQKCLTVLNLGV